MRGVVGETVLRFVVERDLCHVILTLERESNYVNVLPAK